MLSVSQTALTFENSGGNQSVTLTANKVWTASSNQGWLRVSPSSGEGTTTLSISCEGNTTYDSRTGNITIVSEELTLTISVTQAEGLGLLISQPEYNLSNEAQTISVTVQANVQYTVDIDNACRDWIKQESTKGLSSNTIKFAISKNESYDGREGKITIRQTNGNLSATVIVKQSQTNGLFAEKTEYEVSYEEQTLSIKVISNVDYDVQIDDSCKDWISRVQTKGLAESTLTLSISQNGKEERKGSVVLKYANLQVSITIKQASGFVVFEDDNFKAFCIENYDKNRDGEVSYDEINQVESLSVNTDNITSLQGIEFMPNLLNISAYASNNFSGKLSSLDVSKNTALISLHCYGNSLSSIDLSKNAKITSLSCIYNQLTSLDVSNNTALTSLSCSGNHISSLDVSKNLSLVQLTCGSNNLSSLDISNNTALSWLWCDTNQLPILDVSKNTELTALHCLGNLITSLNVSNNDLIEYLNCTENPFLKVIWLKKEQRIKYLYYDKDVASITYVDEIISFKDTNFKAYCVENFDTDGDGEISFFEAASVNKIECMKRGISSLEGIRYFTELTYLDCGENRLTALDVKSNKALVTLICYNNELTSLSLSGIPSLMELHCGVNNITSLDLRGNTSLISINCQVNQLSSLDISECPSLKTLACNGNKLATLNVSNNTALSQLWCGSNPLTSLDVSKNTELTWLWFGSTPLTSLDVSNNTVLNYLWCYNNPFLTEIWLKTNQTIEDFQYDKDIATIKYK